MDYRTRMKNIREDRDLTQSEVGEVINKSQQGYNHIETGRAELKIDDLIKLCKFYNVSSDYFIGISDNPKPYDNKKEEPFTSIDFCNSNSKKI